MTDLLYQDDAYLRHCEATVTAVDDRGIRLDRTVFYPTGGGQPGDTGRLATGDGRTVPIVDTVKGDGPGAVIHVPSADAPALAPGDTVTAEIDWDRRYRHMRMHTAMHLVCSVIEGDVTGGQVGAEKSRLDFNVPTGALDKEAIGARLNALIAGGHPVASRWITDAELAERPELVRTMSVKPPSGGGRVRLLQIGPDAAPVDLQPCGGTHVANVAEIGGLAVAKIENKGKQNRRVNIVLVDPA
ncbi:MAG: alanyl-tRNA editing protein [Alphaproteobacteria bacterium]|jgi:misacylated tRNA(Ala) deacylase|nr:alanyl-tRNA editing protein [Alphaproteobacteria bacterium]